MFTEDLSGFFDTGDFADAGTYTHVGASPATVNGIFDSYFVDPLGIEGNSPRFICASSDVSSVAHGDSLVVDSVTYHVVGVEPDGTGVVVLKLQEQ